MGYHSSFDVRSSYIASSFVIQFADSSTDIPSLTDKADQQSKASTPVTSSMSRVLTPPTSSSDSALLQGDPMDTGPSSGEGKQSGAGNESQVGPSGTVES